MTTSNILKRFARSVKTLRLEKGWSQDELARRADLHRTYIGSIERHERNVSLLNVERIAKALKVDAKDLF
ncbi:MAG: helix-turn-helix transcriptional regulator [Sedimentisphaerales bacterium]|nr:helix-turn-helix transcriptional regulator [Sedimentisphaerales bacterium]